MKKSLVSAALVLALLFSLFSTAFASNGTVSVQTCDWASQTYTSVQANVVSLKLNGKALPSPDVPALIQGGRTLVPVRLVGEALNAQVLWIQSTSQAILLKDGVTVVLTLDSPNAVVNGKITPLPDGVPAQIIRYRDVNRTMVPLRFVTETLGAKVAWDQDTYTASLTADLPAEPAPSPSADPSAPELPYEDYTQITSIRYTPETATLFIATDRLPTYRVQNLGDRLVLDFPDAYAFQSGGTVRVNSSALSTVRYAQHGSNLIAGHAHSVRVVLDLTGAVSYPQDFTITHTRAGVQIVVNAPAEVTPSPSPSVTPSPSPSASPAPIPDPPTPKNPEDYVIVIDPGHGGKQPGAVYEDILEKNINLAVARKLEALLRNMGYTVVMTRYDDSHIGLYERAELANDLNADIFVSLHSNAAVNNTAYTGIYTYYHPTSKEGPKLGKLIQKYICPATGAIDRNIMSADYVVVRETNMPAVLVEMGFMTNHDELMNLITPSYQDKLAWGVAQGVVEYLNGRTARIYQPDPTPNPDPTPSHTEEGPQDAQEANQELADAKPSPAPDPPVTPTAAP